MAMKPSAGIAEAGVKTSLTAEAVALFPNRSAASKETAGELATNPTKSAVSASSFRSDDVARWCLAAMWGFPVTAVLGKNVSVLAVLAGSCLAVIVHSTESAALFP